MSISASEARSKLFSLIQQVNEDRVPITITSRGGDEVLIALDDYKASQETAYLFRSPVNARRLLEANERAKSGQFESHQ